MLVLGSNSRPVLSCAVGATAPRFRPPAPPAVGHIVSPALLAPNTSRSPAVVASERPPTGLHIAEAANSAPAATAVVNPSGGATDAHGAASRRRPIFGPSLDGALPGNEMVVQASAGRWETYVRAIGPMQFLPGTWARYDTRGDGDGNADHQNLYDATFAAAHYRCSGGLNRRNHDRVTTAILRYNNSTSYARNVFGWVAAYATGVVPQVLSSVTATPAPLGDMHLENPEGLGPELPLTIHGLPSTDREGQCPLTGLGNQPVPGDRATLIPTGSAGPGCTLSGSAIRESVQNAQRLPRLAGHRTIGHACRRCSRHVRTGVVQ